MRPPRSLCGILASAGIAYLAPLVLTSLLVPPLASAQENGRYTLPVGSQWPGARPWQVDISDDGRYVVYQTDRGDGWRLFLHEIGQPSSREIPGLGSVPYFGQVSPDGQALLFGKKGWIWKAPLAGGKMTLLYASNNFKTWETNEDILVSKGSGGVWRVKADGSRRETKVASVDSASGATNYGRPSLLPGGRGLLISVGYSTGIDLRKIGIVSLSTGKLTIVDEYGVNPRYAESGHILYTQGSTLKAIPFDLNTLKAAGPGVTVVEGVHVYSNMASQFDISRNGVLVYVEGRSDLDRTWPRRLVWVDRLGRESPFDTPAEKMFGMLRLSPNGRFLATEVFPGVQLFDRQSAGWTVLTVEQNTGAPAWSADGTTLFYSKAGMLGRQSVQPLGDWEPLWNDDKKFDAFSITSDGQQLLGTDWTADSDRWRLASVAVGQTPARMVPMLGTAEVIRRNPAISPDGKLVAYVEKTDGLDQVFVQSYPAGGRAILVSHGAVGEASSPLWGASSNELFYRDGVRMVSARLETAPTLRVRSTTALFKVTEYFEYLNTFAAVHDYDPRTDRFLMTRWAIPNPPGTDIQVIENAFDLLRRLAPRR